MICSQLSCANINATFVSAALDECCPHIHWFDIPVLSLALFSLRSLNCIHIALCTAMASLLERCKGDH